MLDVLNHPQMLHSASVHMPIALAMLGIPLVFLSFVLSAERKTFRQAALICYLLLVGSAFAAVRTGEEARNEVPPTIRSEAAKLLENHEMMAEWVWVLGLITAALLALSLINVKALRIPWVYRSMVGLALLVSMFTGGWIAFAAHYGGELVYTHGIGTKQLAAEFDQTPAPGAPESGEPADPAAAPALSGGDEVIPIRPIDPAEAAAVSYVRDIVPIFEKHCIECHDDFQYDGDYDMTTVEAMKLQGAKKVEPGVVPGAPDESGVVLFIRGIYKPQMPKQADPLTEDELHLIRLWIAAGAIDDTDGPAPAPAEETPAPMPEESAAPAEEAPAPVEEAPAPAEEAPAPAPMPEEAPEAPADAPPAADAPAEEMKALPVEEPAPAEPPASAPTAAPEPAPAQPEPSAASEAADPPAPEAPPVADAPPAPNDEGPVIEDQAAAPEPEPAPAPPENDAGAEPAAEAPEVSEAPPAEAEQAAEPVEAPAPAPSAHTPPVPAPAPRKPYRVNNPVRGPLA